MSCRSNGRPTLAEGGVEGAALRTALGARAGRVRLAEALEAGRALGDEAGLPAAFVQAGIAFDLMCTPAGVPRARLCRALKLEPEELDAIELLWEQVCPDLRFDMVRRAVRFVVAVRCLRGGRQ